MKIQNKRVNRLAAVIDQFKNNTQIQVTAIKSNLQLGGLEVNLLLIW